MCPKHHAVRRVRVLVVAATAGPRQQSTLADSHTCCKAVINLGARRAVPCGLQAIPGRRHGVKDLRLVVVLRRPEQLRAPASRWSQVTTVVTMLHEIRTMQCTPRNDCRAPASPCSWRRHTPGPSIVSVRIHGPMRLGLSTHSSLGRLDNTPANQCTVGASTAGLPWRATVSSFHGLLDRKAPSTQVTCHNAVWFSLF